MARAPAGPAPGRFRVALYFLLLGLAFLLVEIGFIHRFSLFLGHPLSAMAITLASFLVSAGLGSGMSGRIAELARSRNRRRRRDHRRPRRRLCDGAAAHLRRSHGTVAVGKVVIAAGLIAPLGFAMGLPFPLGLSRLAAEAPDLVPWAWGINGCASVVAAVLASLLAMEWGFTAVLALALGLYAVAALVFGQGARADADSGARGSSPSTSLALLSNSPPVTELKYDERRDRPQLQCASLSVRRCRG